jgi:hypothetical protein
MSVCQAVKAQTVGTHRLRAVMYATLHTLIGVDGSSGLIPQFGLEPCWSCQLRQLGDLEAM